MMHPEPVPAGAGRGAGEKPAPDRAGACGLLTLTKTGRRGLPDGGGLPAGSSLAVLLPTLPHGIPATPLTRRAVCARKGPASGAP